jgi:hypothetical protein
MDPQEQYPSQQPSQRPLSRWDALDQPSPEPDRGAAVERMVWIATAVAFVVLLAGTLLGTPTTLLALVACAVGAVLLVAAYLPARFVPHAVSAAYFASAALVLLS